MPPTPLPHYNICQTQTNVYRYPYRCWVNKVTIAARTKLIVTVSLYAADISPAIIPDPFRFSTFSPSSRPATENKIKMNKSTW